MTLPKPPGFAHPAHGPESWYPPGVIQRGGTDEWISTSTGSWGFEVLGRDGHSAEAANIDAVREPLFHDPTSRPLGSWITMNWDYYIGVGPGLTTQIPFVLFEFRTAAEVIEAAQGSNPNPFAVTFWDQNLDVIPAHLPPCDGLDPGGNPYVQSDWGDTPFVRILIRDDLLLGGAGDEWSGRAFMAEVVCHELGHVVTDLLKRQYGEGYVIDQACAIFGKPTSAWDGGAWGDRVQEAVAETFKDVMLPKRVYDNRTNVKLEIDHFDDFKTLFVSWADTTYYENEDKQNVSQFTTGGFWAGGYIVLDQPSFSFTPPYQPSYLFTTAGRAAELESLGGLAGSIREDHLLLWPYTEGYLRLHWNFNAPPYSPADYPDWGDSSPQTDARINLGFQFWTVEAATPPGPGQPGNDGVLLGEVSVEVNPELNPEGSGYVDLPFTELPFEVPAGGMLVMFAPVGRTPWEHPYDGGGGSSNDDASFLPAPDVLVWNPDTEVWMFGAPGQDAGAPYLKPWMEAINIPRLIIPPTGLGWPYTGSPPPQSSTLTIGTMDVGLVRFDQSRVREG